MNSDPAWKAHLQTCGAIWQGDRLQGFTGTTPQTGAAQLTALHGYELLRCAGPDTRKFLQGQFTCDVSALTAESTLLGACCNVKGRMVANFRLLPAPDNQDEDLLIHLPAGQGKILQEELARFLPFYKSEMTPIEDWVALGIWGETAASTLGALPGTVPDSLNRCTVSDHRIVVRVHGKPTRFLMLVRADHVIDIWDQLATACLPTGEADWDLQDIRAGVGSVCPALSGTLIPQMLNLQHLDAISFTKGCYTGQEIVARMQYRGTLKKFTFRLQADDVAAAEPGTAICTAESSDAVGTVVQSAIAGDSLELLGVLRADSAHSGHLHLGSPDGAPLTLLDLPYLPITD